MKYKLKVDQLIILKIIPQVSPEFIRKAEEWNPYIKPKVMVNNQEKAMQLAKKSITADWTCVRQIDASIYTEELGLHAVSISGWALSALTACRQTKAIVELALQKEPRARAFVLNRS
jgi:hypothetical protein